MTPLVWVNLPLGLLFFLAVAGIPLWMTRRYPQQAPDHAEARAYLRAKERLVREEVRAAGVAAARLHARAPRSAVPGRKHAAGAALRSHQAEVGEDATTSA